MDLINLFRESLYYFYKNFYLIIPSTTLFFLLTIFSSVSIEINQSFKSGFLISSWLVIFSLGNLLLISYFFAGLISLSGKNSNNVEVLDKPRTLVRGALRASKSPRKGLFDNKMKFFFKEANKFFMKNFFFILLFLVFYNIVNYLSFHLTFFIGGIFSLPENSAKILFLIFYFIGLFGFIIFLAFTNFYFIIFNLSFKEGLIKSFNFVKNNYISVGVILLAFFIFNEIILFLPESFYEIISLIFIPPYLSIILSKFIRENKI